MVCPAFHVKHGTHFYSLLFLFTARLLTLVAALFLHFGGFLGLLQRLFLHAVANGLPVITVNRVGHEPDPSGATNGILFWGNSFVAGPQGELIYRASAEAEATVTVDIDMARTENVRRWWPFLRDRRIDAYGDLTKRYIDPK